MDAFSYPRETIFPQLQYTTLHDPLVDQAAAMTSEETNQACWLDGAGQPFAVREAAIPTAAANEVVIRTHAVAMNPVDAIRQKLGMAIPEEGYPWVIGADGAGVIQALGSDVKGLQVGDRVIAIGDEFGTHQPSHSTFQRYFCTSARHVCKIPNATRLADAVVLPLCLSTAAGALFEKEGMDLSWPRFTDADAYVKQKDWHAKDVVIVWGGSSVVGLCAIQMLVVAGYHVLATASKHNNDLVKEAGAEAVFDYKEDGCVEEVCKWVEERRLSCVGVLASVIDQTGKSVEQCGQVTKRLPGRKFVGTTLARGLMPLPDLGEEIKTSACLAIVQDDLLGYIWKEWVPQALEKGELKCLPRPEIVGHGLDSVNKACEIMGQGVSGSKLVVTDI